MHRLSDGSPGLFTDLYELTMAASYHARGLNDEATFELFVRGLPERRNFLIAAGLDDALHYLETVRFDEEAIAYLRSLGMFREAFLEYLRDFRFTGECWAIPEGEVVFPGEPLIRVTAPRIEAQVVETYLLNCINFQTMVATKAARVAIACGERQFVDFSARRDHGADAAMKAARASYIAGAAGTSNLLAAKTYGIPPSGTMAHSYVTSWDDEEAAFRAFARDFPGRAYLLIDTYDTLQGARHAARVARELAAEGVTVAGVRLDSGDLATLATQVHTILDEAGLPGVRIFASGDLDEYRIAKLLAEGAPIDGFGVGTQLGTSADAPTLGGVYKLVEDGRGPQLKLSTGKATLPGRKQVYRVSSDGRYDHDVLALEGEPVGEGRPVAVRVMVDGRRTAQPEPLAAARDRCARTLAELPARLRALERVEPPYEVRLSPGLRALYERISEAHGGGRG